MRDLKMSFWNLHTKRPNSIKRKNLLGLPTQMNLKNKENPSYMKTEKKQSKKVSYIGKNS